MQSKQYASKPRSAAYLSVGWKCRVAWSVDVDVCGVYMPTAERKARVKRSSTSQEPLPPIMCVQEFLTRSGVRQHACCRVAKGCPSAF